MNADVSDAEGEKVSRLDALMVSPLSLPFSLTDEGEGTVSTTSGSFQGPGRPEMIAIEGRVNINKNVLALAFRLDRQAHIHALPSRCLMAMDGYHDLCAGF